MVEREERGAKSLGEPYRGNLARRLKTLRDERGISQTAFAEAVGLSQPQLSAIERGTGSAGINALIRMREILSVSLDELLGLPPLPSSSVREREDLNDLAAKVAALLGRPPTSAPGASPPPRPDRDSERAPELRRRPRS